MPPLFRIPVLGLALAACVASVASGPSAHGDTFTTITAPIRVPLQWTYVNNSTTERKLGIYVTLGGGTTPQLFEFDTGGNGFYATYSSGTRSPWWGDAWVPAGTGTFNQNFDSGMQYTGTAVTTGVSLFASGTSSVPLLTAANVVVGQTVSISNTNAPPTQLWPLPHDHSPPPVDEAFWGDFGMAPKRGQAGIDLLAGQLLYGDGVTAGFRVHAADESPWVQFGLSAADTAVVAQTFALTPATTGSSAAGVAFYANLVVTGSLSVTSGTLAPFEQPTGFILDTGASTTFHTGTNSSGQTISLPPDLTNGGSEVVDGAVVLASAGSLLPGAGWQPIMLLETGSTAKVKIQDKKSQYYLNTGIEPFTRYDVIYDLAAGQLTLATVPEPSAALLAALGGTIAVVFRVLGRRTLPPQ